MWFIFYFLFFFCFAVNKKFAYRNERSEMSAMHFFCACLLNESKGEKFALFPYISNKQSIALRKRMQLNDRTAKQPKRAEEITVSNRMLGSDSRKKNWKVIWPQLVKSFLCFSTTLPFIIYHRSFLQRSQSFYFLNFRLAASLLLLAQRSRIISCSHSSPSVSLLIQFALTHKTVTKASQTATGNVDNAIIAYFAEYPFVDFDGICLWAFIGFAYN